MHYDISEYISICKNLNYALKTIRTNRQQIEQLPASYIITAIDI